MVDCLESDFRLHCHDGDSFSEPLLGYLRRCLVGGIPSRRSCAISWGDTCSLRRPGTSGLTAGWGPAASDLTARYEDVRTRLDGLSIVPSFRVSVSVSRGAAIKRYPRRSPGYYRFEPMILPPVSST